MNELRGAIPYANSIIYSFKKLKVMSLVNTFLDQSAKYTIKEQELIKVQVLDFYEFVVMYSVGADGKRFQDENGAIPVNHYCFTVRLEDGNVRKAFTREKETRNMPPTKAVLGLYALIQFEGNEVGDKKYANVRHFEFTGDNAVVLAMLGGRIN